MSYDEQTGNDKTEINEIDIYEHNFDINIQKINTEKLGYIPKFEESDGLKINENYDSKNQTKMKFYE